MLIYDKVCTSKKEKSATMLLLGGMIAGIYIAIGALCSQIATAAGMSRVISSALFPVGLIMVVLMGAELFTGNCLLLAGLLSGTLELKDVTKNWMLVYLGNLIGSFLFANTVIFCRIHNMFDGKLSEVMLSAYSSKLDQAAGVLVFKGILCNVLVCTAVWMAIHADNYAGKILSAFIPTFIFVYLGMEHSVANMYFLPVAVLTGGTVETPYILIIRQILIVTFGNIIGGVLVAAWQYFNETDNHP